MTSSDLLTVTETARECRVSPQTIRNWVRNGGIPPSDVLVTPGGHMRIRRSALDFKQAMRPGGDHIEYGEAA